MIKLKKFGRESVRELGDQIGFGYMMRYVQEEWRESMIKKGYNPGGEFIVGPCVITTEPCPDCEPMGCEWCCGTGWLTKHVAELKRNT